VLIIEIDSFVNYLLSKTPLQISTNGDYNYGIVSSDNYDDNRVFSMKDLVDTISIYCNSYALMHRLNKLCVIASLSNSIEIIYPNSLFNDKVDVSYYNGISGEVGDDKNANIFVPFSHTLTIIINKYLKMSLAKQIDECKHVEVATDNSTTSESKLGSLSMAFSTALTIINKQRMKQSRVLVLQFDKDTNQNYNSIMNSIFRCVCPSS